MRKVWQSFLKHKTLVISLGVIFLYSATMTFAVQVAPGTVLDPAGLPGSYTVGPLIAIGDTIGSSPTANGILYANASGALTTDSTFTRTSTSFSASSPTVSGYTSKVANGNLTFGIFTIPGSFNTHTQDSNSNMVYSGVGDMTSVGDSALSFIAGYVASNLSVSNQIKINASGINLLSGAGSNGLTLNSTGFSLSNSGGTAVYTFPAAIGTSGQVLTSPASGTQLTWTTPSAAGVAGSDTQIQFNDGGSMGADAGLIFNKTTDTLTVAGSTGAFGGSSTFKFGGSINVTGGGSQSLQMLFDTDDPYFYLGNLPAGTPSDTLLGTQSVTIGFGEALASGDYSLALGLGAVASNTYATAIGYSSKATGSNDTALMGGTASGGSSLAIGSSTASSNGSIAIGNNQVASTNIGAVAIGYSAGGVGEPVTTATGFASLAMQSGTASGSSSIAIGYGAVSASAFEFTVGSYNTTYTPVSTTAWDSADRLFNVGNGASSGAKSDAFTILKSGAVGIGDVTPDYKLDLETDVGDYMASFFNDGNLSGRRGIIIQTGLDDQTQAVAGTLIRFNDGDGTQVGSITFGSSLTAYNTSSDRRLKENITDTSLSIDTLNKIQIRDFTWIADSEHKLSHGVIAQELYDIYPLAVTRPVDESVDNWMVDYSKLVPLAVKSIQDLDLKIQNINSVSSNGSLAGQLVNMILRVRGLVVGTPERRTGITLYDEVTGEPYCMSVASGAPKTVSGECVEVLPPASPEPEPQPESLPQEPEQQPEPQEPASTPENTPASEPPPIPVE